MKKYIYVFSIAIGINFLLSLPVYGQNALTQTLNTLQKRSIDFPFEKAYLHTDKSFYGAGDTIWFKAYVVTGSSHHLSDRSGVLDVELINGQNTLIRHIKLPLIGGITRGDFILGDTIAEGNYRIRAYTNWMRNIGPEYFFDKTIKILNAVTNKVFTHTTYNYSTINDQQAVNAAITYTNLDGIPYTGKEVKYEIHIIGKKSARGKGITDEKGILHISLDPAVDVPTRGQLITNITIDNQQTVVKVIPLKAVSAGVDVQFFPESGSLVNGLVSKVAFKAVGSDGLGADIKGTITDDQNNNIANFSSTHLGMGFFYLVPEAGRTYKAKITNADGITRAIDLPKVVDKGDVMTIRSDSVNIIVKINRQGDENIADSTTLVAQSGGEIYARAKGRAGKTSLTAIIPKSKLTSGIVQFTLFSDSGEPLNERLVFVQNPDKLNLNLSIENKAEVLRQKVRINLNAKNSDGQPVQGNFSVAVIDESKVTMDEATESTILSNILLTSDIKGYIEKPNYYFTNTDQKTATDLDVLMMTQGYHRFEWKKLIPGAEPELAYQPEKSLSISGTLTNTDGLPITQSKLTLINTATNLLLDTLTDKNGRFVFNLDFMDSCKFALKTGKVDESDILIKLDRPVIPVNENKNSADELVNVDNGLDAFLKNDKTEHEVEVKYHIGNHTNILKQVNIVTAHPKTEKELKIERAVEFSSNLNGKGVADQVVTSEVFEGKGCPTTAECLQGILLGITFHGGNAQALRGHNSINLYTTMKVFVDGILSGGVNDVNPEDISSIEVLQSATNTAIYGTRGANGVLIVTTKHGNGFIAEGKASPGNISPQGYYKAREFYSPRYYQPSTTQIPDLRTTIYWKPIIQTDKDGNASFEYFNADSKGPYRIVVEGIDYKSGAIGRQVLTYHLDELR